MDIIKKTLKKNEILQVLQNRSFFSLMLSEFFSQTAFNMQHFVIIFIIFEIYKSNSAVSGVILSFTIPAIIFSVMAGVYVDRWNKKKVLFATNFIRAAVLLLFLIPTTHLAYLYFLTFLLAVATQFFLPAEAPMIPLLVEKELLAPANAVFGMGIFTTVLIGYILSGPALLFLGRFNVFILLSALFFISAILVLFIKSTGERKKSIEKPIDFKDSVVKSFVDETKQVLSFIHKTKEVTNALILLTFAQTIIFIFAALGPGYVVDILDIRVESLSWILLAPAALGMIVGSFVMGSYAKKIKSSTAVTIGFLVAGFSFILLPFGSKVLSYGFIHAINSHIPHFFEINILHFIVFLVFIAGLANALLFVPSNTIIQTETSDEFRGRVYGLLNALIGAVSLLPVAIAGGLADIFGVGTIIFSVGLLVFLIGVIRVSGVSVLKLIYPDLEPQKKRRS